MSPAPWAATIVRGARGRGGSSVMILVVALVAVAAATIGPTYDAAARTSILRDSVGNATVVGRGLSVDEAGPVATTLPHLVAVVGEAFATGPAPAIEHRFQPPIESIEATAYDPGLAQAIPLDWRSDVCAHLQFTGTCATDRGQVMVSASLAKVAEWRIGDRAAVTGWGDLVVTGIYQAPGLAEDYWFSRQMEYFPSEYPPASSPRAAPPPASDAMFTAEATLTAAPPAVQGTVIDDDLLATPKLQASDAGPLSAAISSVLVNPALESAQAVPTSAIPATMAAASKAWSSLAVPIFLVSGEVLTLAWLMLFLLLTESVAARGAEVALAKLRGYGRLRLVAFAVREPASLLLVALPLGGLAGWGLAVGLGRALLVRGTPVAVSGLGWAAATAATAGGLVAVVVAAARTLRRPVLDLWRRAGRRVTDRGWVLDAILLTGAVAGLVDLELSGTVSSTRHSALGLLVPGLLGLAVAVVASRALPVASRLAAGWGRSTSGAARRGGIAWWLALRHMARRPGAARTTIMLATSFALATFALAAWAVGQANYRRVAGAELGASTVLTVTPPPFQSLAGVVAQADPTGRQATPVEEYTNNDVETLAVDPPSWLRVTGLAGSGGLAGALAPAASPPLILTGDQVRVTLEASNITPAGNDLTIDVVTATGEGTTPVDLGTIPDSGSFTATGDLATCPCRVVDFTVVPNPSTDLFGVTALTGTLTLSSMAVHDGGTWRPADASFASPSRWRSDNGPGTVYDQAGRPVAAGAVSPVPAGLQWSFGVAERSEAVLASTDHPPALPALVAAHLTIAGHVSAPGLNGQDLPIHVVATEAAIPGAPANGVVVDRAFAELAADNNLGNAIEQVWLANGATSGVEARLRAEGVRIDSTETRARALDLLRRQGPGLAGVLFLAEGGAAAALAAGGAIVGLYLSARRRRYEYAALRAAGIARRTLRAALAVEQVVVVALGTLVGVATGLLAARIALPTVPEFVDLPPAPALRYGAPAAPMVVIGGAAVVVVLLAALAAGAAVMRGIRTDQLREAPA